MPIKQARRATMDRSYRYLRILFGIRDKNGNSFHNLKKGEKRDEVIKFQAYKTQKSQISSLNVIYSILLFAN